MTPEVVATHPQEVRRLAQEFRDAGAEVLQTLTFFGTANTLARAGLGDRAEEINRTACQIARERCRWLSLRNAQRVWTEVELIRQSIESEKLGMKMI